LRCSLTFGAAFDAKCNLWLSSYGSKSSATLDKNGKFLTPPQGIHFGGRRGLMQGIIATPSEDVWERERLETPRILYKSRSGMMVTP